GKTIRPELTLVCSHAAGGTPECAVGSAVAVELVHDFSLLHDDVMDQDTMRRHRSSAWTVFGTGRAVLTGDALLVLALRQPSPGAAVHALVDAMLDLCRGQASDLAFETRPEVSICEATTMTENKTGALFGAACQLGALAAGCGSDTAEHYRI